MSVGGITARWAKPVIPIGVEDSSKVLFCAGRTWNMSTFILEHDDVERVRLGYVCINCLEPHEQNHPERCGHCGFPIRSIQDDVFEEMYEGEERVGPSTTLEEEMQIAQELVDRDNR